MSVEYILLPFEEGTPDERKMIDDGGARFGEFSLWDLADHHCRINHQLEAIEGDEGYPNKEKEMSDLLTSRDEEEIIANKVIDQFSFDINFEDLLASIRG